MSTKADYACTDTEVLIVTLLLYLGAGQTAAPLMEGMIRSYLRPLMLGKKEGPWLGVSPLVEPRQERRQARRDASARVPHAAGRATVA